MIASQLFSTLKKKNLCYSFSSKWIKLLDVISENECGVFMIQNASSRMQGL